ncbi:PIN domain-containing protein [Desulfobacterales bacterium HSG17]|nr:PIN domain-containing protein [Desulfobacterales bacterium HSG17]
MNINYATDTMALILRLERRKLNPLIKSIFKKAEDSVLSLCIPAMVMAEIGYLSEKKRIETSLEEVFKYIKKHKMISVEPITGQVIEKTFIIEDIPELHDRIIAATAIVKKAILITNDPVISVSEYLEVVW